MEITYACGGREFRHAFKQSEVQIGRPGGVSEPDLDLSPDLRVSRRHARIWWAEGVYWVEDQGSRFGTFLNGEPLPEKRKLNTGDTLLVGETILHVQIPPAPPEAPAAAAPLMARSVSELSLEQAAEAASAAAQSEAEKIFSGLLEVPFLLGRQRDLDDLLQHLLERILSFLPRTLRGLVLLLDETGNSLVPRAQVAMNLACIDETLARRAMNEASGLYWHRGPTPGSGYSGQPGHAGMYAPLLWDQKPMGVLVVDNPNRDKPYEEVNLRILLATAQQIALALANFQLQENVLQQRRMLDGALHQFSPNARNRLLDRARHSGAPPKPPEKSEAGVLAVNLRELLCKDSTLGAPETAEMLHDYLGALRDAVFKFDGLIFPCSMENMVAIFGAFEPDAKWLEKAVRATQAIQWALQAVNSRRDARRKAVAEVGIGLHGGEIFHGFAGPLDRFDFIAQGEPIVTACQLAAAAKPGEVLITSTLHQRVYQQVVVDPATDCSLTLKGMSIYRLKSLNEQGGWGSVITVKVPV